MDIASYVSARQLDESANEQQVRQRTQIIADCMVELQRNDDKSLKEQITNFINKLSEINMNPSNSVKSKFYSLMILNYLTEKNITAERKEEKNSKFFSILASSNFLKELRNIAEEVDPNKPINQKGKNYFSKNQQYGNDYIRLDLELLKYWSSRFPETSKKQKSAYKRYYESLIDKKVTLPTNGGVSKRQSIPKPKNDNVPTPNLAQMILSTTANPGKQSAVQTDVHYMYGKILNFVEDLDGDINQVQPEISTNHKQFEIEMKRFKAMQDDVINSGDEQTIQKYLKIITFMDHQATIHKQFLVNSRDFQSYIISLKMHAETQLPQMAQVNVDRVKSKIKKVESVEYNSGKRKYDSNGGTVKYVSAKQEQPPRPAVEPKIMTAVSNYFNRLQQRSKSPITSGFQKINQSLSKEKLLTKRTVSPLAKNKNLSKSINSLKESKLASIFTSPPNLNPPYKKYDGIEINQNPAIYQQLKAINKSQGLRRFKTANFKGKSSLFENEHLQIGYKSSSLYQQTNGFKIMIKIQVFFGNLTSQNIKGLTLEFKGDPNALLYANPREIQSTIFPSEQNKIELVIIPLRTPFPLLNMVMRYRSSQKQYQHKLIIPNSVLKLAHFMEISKQELASRWLYAQAFKTSQFKLCHYLPPQTFTKWIPALGELTNYNEFATPGSTKDYELYCLVIMLQKYEALLKISIRPNLSIVLQLGIQDKNDEAMSYYKFFLQSLQQFLKEVQ